MASLLIVENNQFFRKLLKDFLGRRFPGLSIDEATDGEKALLKILTHAPDVILMDVQLTGQNGLKLTKQIKSSHPESSILLFSSYDLPELQQIARDNGADRLIQKDEMMDAGIPEFIQTVLENLHHQTDASQQPRKFKRKLAACPTSYRKPRLQARRRLSSHDLCY